MIRITWRRRSSAPTPEEQYENESLSRQKAVETVLQDAGIDPDTYEYVHPPRHLSGTTSAFFTVCELVIENPEWAALVYWYLKQNDANDLVADDEIEKLAEEQLEKKLNEMEVESK